MLSRDQALAADHVDAASPYLYCAYLTFAKMNAATQVRAAAKHNLREIPAERYGDDRIDPSRTHLNEHLAGPATAHEVAVLARARVADAGIKKLRKDAVRCIEFVISPPPGHGLDEDAFFAATLAWLGRRFGGIDNVLSADVHRDQSNPHMHVLVLPLINGRMTGSDAIGGPPQLAAFYREFHQQVAAPFGLDECPARLTKADKATAVDDVLQELRRRGDVCIPAAAWLPLRNLIAKDPLPLAMALGLNVRRSERPKRLRSSTAIFISKGKGSQRRGVAT